METTGCKALQKQALLDALQRADSNAGSQRHIQVPLSSWNSASLRCSMYLSRHLQQAHREVDWLGRCALSLARFSFGLRFRVRERRNSS